MHKSESGSSGKTVDKFLLSLDEGAFGALYRVSDWIYNNSGNAAPAGKRWL